MPDAGDVARMKRIGARIQAAGVRVLWVAGWESRGGTFPIVPVAGFVHHDASNRSSGKWGALGIITHGRGGERPVRGPLSQFQGARGRVSEVAIVAAGTANHGGLGGPHKGIPQNSANPITYGMEVANNGVDEPYSPETIYTIRVVQAAIAAESRFEANMVIGHKEWAPTRKIDPRYSMVWMRNLVQETMRGGTTPPPTEDDDMTPEQEAKIDWITRVVVENQKRIGEVWSDKMQNPHHPEGVLWRNRSYLKWAYGHSLTAVREVRVLAAQVAANAVALDALAKALAEHHGELNPEAFATAVREASEAGASAALESIPLAAVLVREDDEEEPA